MTETHTREVGTSTKNHDKNKELNTKENGISKESLQMQSSPCGLAMFLLLTTFSQISQSTRAYIFSYPMISFHMHHYAFVFLF